MKKKYLLLLLILIVSISKPANGQLSMGGTPLSFSNEIKIEKQPQLVLPSSNNKYLKSIYASSVVPNKLAPFVFAHSMWANFSPTTHGKWVSSNNGCDVWIFSLKSPNAYSLNLLFSKFVLPPSGKLYIYNPDKSCVLGAFTAINNKLDSLFATSPIQGDEIIIEYSQNSNVTNREPFVISQVNHDFLDIFSILKTKVGGFGSSDDCNVDIAADPNYSLLPQERSVCKIIVNGTEICSGTMLTNTSSDSAIYFLTAAHCLSSQAQATNTLFYYNYQSPNGLGEVQGSIDLQTSGSTLVATSTTGDFTLLKLAGEKPAVAFRPYLSGWNRSISPPAPYFAIHHPSGDVKKISRSNVDVVATSFNNPPFLSDFHWQVPVWDSGTTEGGSSGSGLFDATGTLIGCLSGGEAYCGNSINDYFVRFNKAWDAFPDQSAQLAHWLDFENKSLSTQPFFGKALYELENPQRLTNTSYSDSAFFRKTDSSLALGLYKQSPIVNVAEKFENLSNKKIEGVYVVVGKGSSSVSGNVKVSFWQGDEYPETEIYSFNTPLSYFISKREKYLKVNGEVIVLGNVFVNIELTSPIINDTLGLYVSDISKDNSSRLSNSLLVNDGFQWKNYSEVYGTGKKGSSWIDLVVSDTVSNSIIEKKDDNFIFNVFPTLVNDYLFVESGDEGVVIKDVSLVGMDGISYRMPFYSVSNNKIKVDVLRMLKGVYVLKIESNIDTFYDKIILE